jgi:hypothetical protein
MSEQETTSVHYMWTFFVMEELFCDKIQEEANKKGLDIKVTMWMKKRVFEMRQALQEQFDISDHAQDVKTLIKSEVPINTIMETFKF